MNFKGKIQEIKEKGLYRKAKCLSSIAGTKVCLEDKNSVGGKEKSLIVLSSNNYLSLNQKKESLEKAQEALRTFGSSATGSRLTTGNFSLHEELEKDIASFHAYPSAMLFNCGYMANIGIISTLTAKGDFIFSDELNHASIIDGCRLSKAKTIVYKHRDIRDLEEKIKIYKPKKGLIISDAVFSMDGDIAPLPDLIRISKKHSLKLMLDEAHSAGVIGEKGQGILEHFSIKPQDLDLLMGALSKAFASEGAYLCAKPEIIDYLKNCCRSYIFTSSLAPHVVATASANLRYISSNPSAVKKLQENIKYFSEGLNKIGIAQKGETAIFPVLIGNEKRASKISDYFYKKGILVPAIRYPTVPLNKARLRFSLMAGHDKKELDLALDLMEKIPDLY